MTTSPFRRIAGPKAASHWTPRLRGNDELLGCFAPENLSRPYLKIDESYLGERLRATVLKRSGQQWIRMGTPQPIKRIGRSIVSKQPADNILNTITLADHPQRGRLYGKVTTACDGDAIFRTQVQATAGDDAQLAMPNLFQRALEFASQLFSILPLHAFAADEDQFRPGDGSGGLFGSWRAR
ncbi:MAG: hypothetical protein ABIR16_05640 [Dokdonella sp.]